MYGGAFLEGIGKRLGQNFATGPRLVHIKNKRPQAKLGGAKGGQALKKTKQRLSGLNGESRRHSKRRMAGFGKEKEVKMAL